MANFKFAILVAAMICGSILNPTTEGQLLAKAVDSSFAVKNSVGHQYQLQAQPAPPYRSDAIWGD